jgi:membrane protein
VLLQAALNPVLYAIGTFVATWMVFALIFVLVPNRRVRFRDALGGALLSAVLFELAKFGFVAYVRNANYAVIYGALATVPIFLFWLYLVWVVVLLGASLAASLTTFREQPRPGGDWPDAAELQMAYRLVGHLWQAQREGRKCRQESLLGLEPRVGERQMLRILAALEEAQIVMHDDAGDWMLARDVGDLTLAALYQAGRFHLPLGDKSVIDTGSGQDRAFAAVMQAVRQGGLCHLDQPLRELYLCGEQP